MNELLTACPSTLGSSVGNPMFSRTVMSFVKFADQRCPARSNPAITSAGVPASDVKLNVNPAHAPPAPHSAAPAAADPATSQR